eukprot:13930147-Alexandrium_andersonii.AAC.1
MARPSGLPARHSWELPPTHAWEADDEEQYRRDFFRVEEEEEDPVGEEAGEELFDQIVRLRLSGTLSAKEACTLAYWSSRAGATGPVSSLAANPRTSSGNFQKHLGRVLKLRETEAS